MKAGTATKIVLNTISTGAMVQLGQGYGNLMVDLQVTCEKLQDRGERILMETLRRRPRPRRASLLERSRRHVKTAIVMAPARRRRARRRERALDEAGGVIAPRRRRPPRGERA